jgi:transposase
MDEGIKFFVGLDVHKDSIAVAVAEAGRTPARLIGSIAHDVGKLRKLLARYGEPGAVQVVYEAGPTGYGLQRELARRGYQCQVVRGSITKTGNAHARRLLTEAAWNYRFQARIGRRAQQRAQDLPQAIRDVAWKAQLRLSRRFTQLRARGKEINKVCVAVARELAGFVWAIASTQANLPQS